MARVLPVTGEEAFETGDFSAFTAVQEARAGEVANLVTNPRGRNDGALWTLGSFGSRAAVPEALRDVTGFTHGLRITGTTGSGQGPRITVGPLTSGAWYYAKAIFIKVSPASTSGNASLRIYDSTFTTQKAILASTAFSAPTVLEFWYQADASANFVYALLTSGTASSTYDIYFQHMALVPVSGNGVRPVPEYADGNMPGFNWAGDPFRSNTVIDRAKIVRAPQGGGRYQREYAFCAAIYDNDPNPAGSSGQRSETYKSGLPASVASQGGNVWFGWETYFPVDYQPLLNTDWNSIIQWHNADANNTAPMWVSVNTKEPPDAAAPPPPIPWWLYVRTRGGTIASPLSHVWTPIAPYRPGWWDFIGHIVFGQAGVGRVRLWVADVKLVDVVTPIGYTDVSSNPNYIKIGTYSNDADTKRVIYSAGLRVGEKRVDVDPSLARYRTGVRSA